MKLLKTSNRYCQVFSRSVWF